ncbi:TonB-dependent receptor domain-containing protein [Sphingobium sp. WCS2017Hpa-17]|uniref:TonB-dependent receptor domain-containing protein n=1 Tax=Sphingobium sp. WCS2017Hpa-17 TaxID=3073638 RepID=UPI00288C53A4|nr:TonB-dependent receptor [Sphingobium sp. WCS2017Hpa-17]
MNRRTHNGRLIGCTMLLLTGGEAMAHDAKPAPADPIVVNGRRQIGETQPLRHFDAEELRAMGITSIKDMMQRLGAQLKGADGANPVFAINGRRPLDDEEVQSLPFDAIQSFDLLPQEAASAMGYPPNQPVMNFTTKAKFQGFEAMANGQTSTDGGGGTGDGRFAMTRLRGKKRLTLTATLLQQSELRQDRRSIRPDPSLPYDRIGNVTGADGGEIDPQLSALAGSPVTIAAVPLDPDARQTLAAYLPGANQPHVTDPGAYRNLQPRQSTMKIAGFFSQPISDRTTAALSLSIERQRSWALQGLGTASLLVPAGNSSSPFASDILLNRYLDEVPALTQNGSIWTLHAGLGLIGGFSGWNWSLRLNHDRKRSQTDSDLGFDMANVQDAILLGGDAFSPFSAGQIGAAIRDRARSTITTNDAQLILNGQFLTLPAGPVAVTTTFNAQRSSSDSLSRAFPDANVVLGRSQGGSSLAATIPIASAADNVLPFLGRLSVDLSGGVNAVSRYGPLYTAHASLVWTPVKRVQLLATLKRAETAPTLDQLGAPRIATPNMPFVDLVSGESLFVTSVYGGNPDLSPERRRTLTLTANIQPLRTDAFRASLIYEDATIHDQSATISVLTPAIAAAFPDRFLRDAAGQLTTVDLRPVNLYRERQRTVKATLSFSGEVGSKPEKPPEGQPPSMTYLYASLTPALRLEDRLSLSPGTTPLDLLDGDNIVASGGRPRWDVQGDMGLYRNGIGMFVQSVWHSGSRARSMIDTADLRFASLGTTSVTVYADMERLLPKAGWAKKLMIDASIRNIANARPAVRDRLGDTPISQQPAYLDPLGRVVSLRLFKRF